MKKISKNLTRILMVAFSFLFFFSLALTNIYSFYADTVNNALGIETTRVVSEGEKGEAKYKSDYATVEEEFKAKMALSREIVQEGVALLKNEGNALPINVESDNKVAVYFSKATGAFDANFDSINSVHFANGTDTTSAEERFILATNHPGASFLDRGTQSTSPYMSQNAMTLTKALAFDGVDVNKVVVDGVSPVTAASGYKTAIVVIGRVGGERQDLDYSNNALALDVADLAAINLAKSSDATNVILLVSGDNPMEIGSLVNDTRINGIVHVGNVGFRGAYGVADVLTGKVSPSGKLVDTYVYDTHSHPSMTNFGDYVYSNAESINADSANKYVAQLEGIYVDYRYFETRYEDSVLNQGNASSAKGATQGSSWNYNNEVAYSFGYGLSYTELKQEIVGTPIFNEEDHTATIKVKVSNNGSVASKDVVAIYGQAPYTDYDVTNKVEKSSIQLLGFNKTGLIEPGKDETVDVVVHMQWFASYDYVSAKTYIMDEGDYYLALGNGAHDALNNVLAEKGKGVSDGMTAAGDASKVYKWHQDALDTTTYSKSVYNGASITNRFEDVDINYWYNNAYTYLSRSDWDATYPESLSGEKQLAATQKMIDFYNDKDRYGSARIDTKARNLLDLGSNAQIFQFRDLQKPAKVEGYEIVDLFEKDYSDELWDSYIGQLTYGEVANLINVGGHGVEACPSITFVGASGTDNPIGLNCGYKYIGFDADGNPLLDEKGKAKTLPRTGLKTTDGINNDEIDLYKISSTVYPSEPILAATFNEELAERVGDMMAEDGLYSGQSFCWGLGANFHRNPYGGRASEYFSADPVLDSLIGAREAMGAWKKGFVMVAKHFATNDQESNRSGVTTFLNEQQLREIQLRAFEGIMTYGECKGVMGTYNRIGLQNTCSEYDLMTGVLRQEWDAKCYVITDLCSSRPGLYEGDAMLAAGVDIFLAAGGDYYKGKTAATQVLKIDIIKQDVVLSQAERRAAHNLLYVYLHTNCMNTIGKGDSIESVPSPIDGALLAAEISLGVLGGLSLAFYLIRFNWRGGKEHE